MVRRALYNIIYLHFFVVFDNSNIIILSGVKYNINLNFINIMWYRYCTTTNTTTTILLLQLLLLLSTNNNKNYSNNYRWRWQVDGGPTAFDVRVSPDWQTGADRGAAGRRGAWWRYTDFRRIQHVVRQSAIRKRTDYAQEVAVGTGRWSAKPPATCWT